MLRRLGMLNQAKYCLPGACLKTVCSSILEPYFRYCCTLWVICDVTEKNSKFDAPSRPLVQKLGWKTIDELIAEESTKIIYKSLYELASQYLYQLFTKISAGKAHILRTMSTDLKIPNKSSAKGQRCCFSCHEVELWNSLPTEAK